MKSIADAARELVRLRDAWLNPPGASDTDLKSRTLTKLYNQRPAWLENAHRSLDCTVLEAYGLARSATRDGILSHLLQLNRERAAGHVQILKSDLPPKKSPGVERLPKRVRARSQVG